MRGMVVALALAVTAQGAGAQEVRPSAALNEAELSAYRVMPIGHGAGPYPAVMEIDPDLPGHVVYRPSDVAALGSKRLGVLAWGNGGCRDDGASARQHLIEIASYGYLVVAPGGIRSGLTATEQPAPRTPDAAGRIPQVATSAADVRAGLDWALKENRRRGSRYFGRIDPEAVAVAGHSCGGLQALQLAGDPRVHAVLIHNSGVFADGSNPIQGITVDKTLLQTLHTPIVYFLGGPSDVAFPNGSDDFQKIDNVPAVLVNLPVGHGGTFFREYGGAIAAASIDWLEWQLRGDKSAGRTFSGANCRLCNAQGWTIERKGIR